MVVKREHNWLFNAVNEGDGLKLLDWMKEKKEKATLAFLDPQYKSTKSTTDRYCYLGDEPPHHDQNSEQIKEFCHKIARVLKDGGWLALWINQEILLNGGYRYWLPPELQVKSLLIWTKRKGNSLEGCLGQTQNHFIHTEEYCILARKKPFESPVLKKRTSNIFNHYIGTGKRFNVHMKPYKMLKSIIKQLTNKGDLVIDTCAGSFGVLIACQSIGRTFLGCDISVGELMRFNINRENSRALLNATKSESKEPVKKNQPKYIRNKLVK